jgi:hypothetical protein
MNGLRDWRPKSTIILSPQRQLSRLPGEKERAPRDPELRARCVGSFGAYESW